MEENLNESNLSVYNEQELEYLDKYSPLVNNAFDVINLLFNLILRNLNFIILLWIVILTMKKF